MDPSTEENECCKIQICEKVCHEENYCCPLEPDQISVFNFTNDLLPFDPSIDIIFPVLDIEIPEFPVKINVNTEDELPSLDQLPIPEEVNDDLSCEDMQNIMNDIEDTVNFTSISESMYALNNPDFLFSRIQSAFDTFKEKTGRQMSYSEMRQMMG